MIKKMNGCIDHEHVDTSITPPSILRSLSRPIKDLIQQKEVDKQKNPSTKSYYQFCADKKGSREIKNPSRAFAHIHSTTTSSHHLFIFRSLKIHSSELPYQADPASLSHSISSSLESIEGGKFGEPSPTTRVCSSVSFFVPFLISFIIFLLDLSGPFSSSFPICWLFLLFRRNSFFPYSLL